MNFNSVMMIGRNDFGHIPESSDVIRSEEEIYMDKLIRSENTEKDINQKERHKQIRDRIVKRMIFFNCQRLCDLR